MPAFNLNKGNQTAQNRLKLQKERSESDELAMPDARRVPLSRVLPNPFQVRQDFDTPEAQQALQELAEDIKKRDILEPLIVRPVEQDGKEYYEIVAGERRYRAARLAGKTNLPVIVKENWTERDARLASLAENLQRRNLSLLEEVQFFQALENEYNYTYKKIAQLINKSESYVSRRLRLAADPRKLAELSEKGMSLSEALVATEEIVPENNGGDNSAAADPAGAERGSPASSSGQKKPANPVRLVAFTRFRQALDRLTLQLEKEDLDKKERERLVAELDSIEEGLAHLKASLTAGSKARK